ncbi:DUF4062 domain-containing protein [Rhodococcus sp. 14-2483-1-2]|uniref:DUF4062 domain-containing protein n=1 Tax=Rhodococcus sp. 14-2483-1-2 TaxID=2023147 RepID=UPI001482518C|nr:DUF4062 domain-containing protein [Rhodococcus sp. 14-2483-1-2]
MRVFISSVRRGLEEERDALPGLISAIGFEPIRFENFGASPTPSREACLEGVARADVYVLLLGPNYGHRFADTMQSPTHDEWVAATKRGIPRLVYVKNGVEVEPDQQALIDRIGNYGSGVFYDTFDSVAELQTKVAGALRSQAAAPSDLTFAPLSDEVNFEWRRGTDPHYRNAVEQATLEVHVQPVPATRRTTRQMHELADTFARRIRETGLVADDVGISAQRDTDSVSVAIPERQEKSRSWNDVRHAVITGVRANQSGQVSVFAQLPGDSLGSLFDQEASVEQIAECLRLVGALRLVTQERLAIAVGIDPTSSITIGIVANLPRNQASFGTRSNAPIRVEPDESVSQAALSTSSLEVSRLLARTISEKLR